MTTSRLLATTKAFKAQLLQHEAEAQRTLSSAYANTLKTIQPTLDNLYKQIEAKQQAGETIPPSWIYEEHRLQAIKQLIGNQMSQYGATAQTVTGAMQHTAAQLGIRSAYDQLHATLPKAVSWSFGIPSSRAIESLISAMHYGSPLYDIFQRFGAAAAQEAGDALVSGLTQGNNPRVVASAVQEALDTTRARALTIARTEMLRAYRSANMETYRANSDVVSGWIWICSLGLHSCAACVAMHGTHHSLDEALNDHVCGACSPAPETKSWSDILSPLGIDTSGIEDTSIDVQSGSDWFDSQDEATQRKILGNSKYEAFSNNVFTLQDIVGVSQSDDWGSSIYEKPLKELVK